MNFMKKTVPFVLLVIMLIISCACAVSPKQAEKKEIPLASLDEAECMEFLARMGVEIPDEIKNIENSGKWIKKLVAELENEPEKIYAISYTVVHDFIEDVRRAVNDYKEHSQ